MITLGILSDTTSKSGLRLQHSPRRTTPSEFLLCFRRPNTANPAPSRHARLDTSIL